MSVADIYEKRATFSFEVFPPKTDVGMEKLCGKDGVLDKLYTLEPDYISCTYGAGGTNVGKNLFTIAVAGSPEGHIQCRSLEADIAFLKQKQDNGADFIISQLCWDMDAFRYWLEAIRNAGIWLPVDVGIMPILDQAATINMALSRNGCVMDRKLCEIISKNWIFPNPFDKEPFDADVAGKKESFRKAGIEYTINQIDEYRACGVDGIHLYALNKYDDVAYIAKEAGLIDLV